MNVTHPIRFTVDGRPVTDDRLEMSVREFLRVASEQTGRDLHGRAVRLPDGTELLSASLAIRPREGAAYTTRKMG